MRENNWCVRFGIAGAAYKYCQQPQHVEDGDFEWVEVEPRHRLRKGMFVARVLRDTADPETGQRYTVKRYESRKAAHSDSWQHEQIMLKPTNPDFESIALLGREPGELQMIAELVEVLGDI